MDERSWIDAQAPPLATLAARELEALVAVSSPSGDVPGAEAAFAIAAAALPADCRVERLACSSPGHANDLLATVDGSGTSRVLLVGHVDTVVAHDAHRPLSRDGDRLFGSGSVDMKGGVALALGVLRALAELPGLFAQLALLLVADEEWRTAPFVHAGRFAGWDACLCFEAGATGPDGDEGVIVRRKAAATLHVTATGRAAHAGSAPERGRNALLALAAAAQAVAACHEPSGTARLTAVPTILNSGSAFNVVPPSGDLWCDLRADALDAIEPVVAAIPSEHGGVALQTEVVRRWPGMDARDVTAPVLASASALLGAPLLALERGGASDASHMAGTVPMAIDGLGPRGGGAHAPEEHVLASSFEPRARAALAVALAALRAHGAERG
jgi:glutamate carboxypeptidase